MAKPPVPLPVLAAEFGPHAKHVPPGGWQPVGEVDRVVKTHCCFCGQQCGIQLKVKDNRVVGFEPWEDFPFNRGKLCPKGVKRYMQGDHPDRLLSPLENVPGTGFRPIAWEAALDPRYATVRDAMLTNWPFYVQTSARVGWVWADAENVLSVLRESMSQQDHPVQYAALEAGPDVPLLGQLRVPTLVLATRDEVRPMGGEPDGRRVAAQIANARLVVFDDVWGGFAPQEGTPPAITAIQQFLEDSGALRTDTEAPPTPAGLSNRELDVLRLIAAGKTNPEIGAIVGISARTVQTHLEHVFAKLGVAFVTSPA